MTKTTQPVLAASEPIPGIWCPTCLVSSAYMVDIHQLCEHGVDLVAVVVVCPQCGEWEMGRVKAQ